jgi:hypothetical protein
VIELFGILKITRNIDEEKQWVDLRAAEQSRAASYELFDGLKNNT